MAKGDVLVRMKADVSNYDANIAKARRTLEGFKQDNMTFGGVLNQSTKSIVAAAAQYASFAAVLGTVASGFSEAVSIGTEMAREMEGVKMAFGRLNQPGLLDNLREATHNTVNDLELMKQAVKFDNFNLSMEQMGTFLAFAQQQAKDTGQDVNYLVDSIVTGLGRKSLPILDNLGLSATEIKNRMKETGDMTTAVAQIIQERMEAAGGYVETASDRAAQATVELENAMTSLGETFAPLVGASDSLWNSIKIGAINALNTAVRPLIQALAEAGTLGQGARSSAGFNNLGGNSKVDRMIGRLGNGKSEGAYSIYKQQLAEFDKYINNKKFKIAAYGGDNSSVAQSAKAKLQTELDGALKMREEYVKRAQELHNQVPSPAVPASTSNSVTGKGGSGGNIKTEQTEMQKNQQTINELTQEYVNLSINATDETKQRREEIQNEIQDLERRNNLLKLYAEQAQGKLQGGDIQTTGLGSGSMWGSFKDKKIEGLSEETMEKVREAMKPENRVQESMARDLNKFTGYAEKTLGGVGDIVGGLSQLGVEIPKGLQDVISGIQGVTSIVTGIASLVAMIEALTTVQTTESTIKSIPVIGWALAHGGIVRAAQGYVPGNSYSGDRVPALLNSGELVLNRAQQNSLANELQGNGMKNMRLRTEVSGRNLIVVIENDLKATGKGQLVTFKG